MNVLSPVAEPDDEPSPPRFAAGEEMLPGLRAWALLGDGNRCETWLAWSTELWTPVAVKLPLATQMAETRSVERLEREGAAMALCRHPTIERLLMDRHADAVPHLVKEYVEGPNLALLVECEGPLESTDAIRLGMQVACGLHHMHRVGLVHHDLKPQNIVLREGRPVVLDLDLARPIGTSRRPGQRRPEGSRPWMAPEQCRMEPASPSMDIFGLGAVLYEISTGSRPFRTRGAYPQLTTRPLRPRARRAEITPALEEVIWTLMEPDPCRRPGSAVEVLALLERALPDGEEALWPEWAGRLLSTEPVREAAAGG